MILLEVTTANRDFVSNSCQDLMMKYVSNGNIATITVKGTDHCCIIHDISKSDSIDLSKNAELDDYGYI